MNFEKLRGKRILITGGAGFIGSNLAIRLIKEGLVNEDNRVIIVDNLDPRHGGNLHNLKDIKNYIEFHHLDIRESRSMRRLMKGVDVVFHLAGQVNHMDGEADPEKDLQVNLVSTLSLLQDALEVASNAKIINASTRQFYGNQEGPFNEETPVDPVDFNGIFLLGADLVMKHFYRAFGLKTVNLRMTNIYGPRQLVRELHGNPQGVVPIFVRLAMGGETLKVMCNDDGKDAVRDPLYVEDAVNALLIIASENSTDGETYIIGGRYRITLFRIASLLIELTGKGTVEKIPLPPERKRINITKAVCDYTKIKREFGWEPKVNLREGLKKTINFYQDPSNKDYYF